MDLNTCILKIIHSYIVYPNVYTKIEAGFFTHNDCMRDNHIVDPTQALLSSMAGKHFDLINLFCNYGGRIDYKKVFDYSVQIIYALVKKADEGCRCLEGYQKNIDVFSHLLRYNRPDDARYIMEKFPHSRYYIYSAIKYQNFDMVREIVERNPYLTFESVLSFETPEIKKYLDYVFPYRKITRKRMDKSVKIFTKPF